MADDRSVDLAPGEPVEALLVQTFAPLHKRALGVAVATTVALGLFLLTAFHIVVVAPPTGTIELLSQYFYGYGVDWSGAVIGACWGWAVGFTAGWLLAFTRNLAAAVWLRVVRARAELLETRDILDHM